MRVLAVLDRAWPCDHAFLEEVLAIRLPRHGCELTCVMPAMRKQNEGSHQWHNCSVIAIYGRRRLERQWRIARALRSLLTEEHWDLLFVRNDTLSALVANRHRKDAPLIFQLSHQKEETALLRSRADHGANALVIRVLANLGVFLRRRVMQHADLVLPISTTMAADLRMSGERKDAMEPMPLGASSVDPPSQTRLSELREKLGVDVDTCLLLYLGTLNRLRHLDVLLQALRQLVDAGNSAVLVFVGEGPDASDGAYLRKRAHELGLDGSVRFVGRIPRAETIDYIGAADFGLSYFPSHPLFRQNSPTKVMEYLGMGLPVVCTPQPEQEKIVRLCKGGVVATDDSASAVAKAIVLAMNREWSREQIRERLFAHRDYDSLAERLGRIFSNVANYRRHESL